MSKLLASRVLLLVCVSALAACSRSEHEPRAARASAHSATTTGKDPVSSQPPPGTPPRAEPEGAGDAPGSARGPSPTVVPDVSPPAPAEAVPPLSSELSRAAASLVIAIGDMHGDLDASRRALRLAGAIDDADQWVGGALVLVQTGDVLDRGDDDRAVFDLLERLRPQARKAGGQLLALSGNHELMNVALDFRYITSGGMAAFGGESGRAAAFRPGGSYAVLLAQRPIVAKVGDTVFVHGGVLPKHVSYGLDRMNDEVHAWMLGKRADPPSVILVEDGLVWTRAYSFDSHEDDCALLMQALAMLGAKRMVVGHTPQLQGITSACDERVWRIDTGMSRFYGGPVEVLELRGETVKARKESPSLSN